MTDKTPLQLEQDANKAQRQVDIKVAKKEQAQDNEGLEKVREVVILGITRDIRIMRIVVVIVAMAVPLCLLWLLLSRIYYYLPWLIYGKTEALTENAAMISNALTAPMTALIIGTFASFIVVYSALLFGVLKGVSDSSREKQSESDIQSIAAKVVQSAMKGGSGNGA